jgi:hypothetical protein
MPARLFHINLKNSGSGPLEWVADGLEAGEWTDPWYPSQKAKVIAPGQTGSWRSESNGIMTGTEGWVLFKTYAGQPPHTEYVRIYWSVPYVGYPIYRHSVTRHDPRDTPGSGQFPHAEQDPPAVRIQAVFKSSGDQEDVWNELQNTPALLVLAMARFLGPVYTQYHVFLWLEATNSVEYKPPAFPSFGKVTTLSPSEQIMRDFRYRAEWARELAQVGGYPNFHEATYGIAHVGGTVFANDKGAEWRNVLHKALGSPALDNPGARFRATHQYAVKNGFVGGFPTFYDEEIDAVLASGKPTKELACGTVLLGPEAAEWRDVPLDQLGNVALDDIRARFRATHDYATSHGYVGGFPNLYHKTETMIDTSGKTFERTVCGTILLKKEAAEWRDVVLYTLPR